MTERAGRWVAVSTGGQDERDQEPDIDRWIADHGYEPAETYRLHGVSRYKGTKRHDAELDRAVEDMRRGHINVLIVWISSRIERRGAYSVFDLARRVRETGGRIEYVRDSYLNDTHDMSDAMLAMSAAKDKKYSKDLSDNVLKAHRSRKDRGSYIGRARFGYDIWDEVCGTKKLPKTPWPNECKLHRKVIVANDDAPAVVDIYERVAAGGSLREVGGVYGMWDGTIQDIIRRETYKGRHHHGSDVMTVPAIVTPELWRRANDRLDGTTRGHRNRRGRTEDRQDALLTSILYCGPCHDAGIESPMYRGGNGNYYRCTGTGRDRLPCAAGSRYMISLDAVDIMAVHYLTSGPLAQGRYTQIVVIADDRQDRIEQARDRLTDAMNSRPMDPALVGRLAAEVGQVEAEDPTGPTVRPVDMQMTIGEHWMSMDRDGRRQWLLRDGWRMWAWKDDVYGVRLAAQERFTGV